MVEGEARVNFKFIDPSDPEQQTQLEVSIPTRHLEKSNLEREAFLEVAKQLFAKLGSCAMPEPSLIHRFLQVDGVSIGRMVDGKTDRMTSLGQGNYITESDRPDGLMWQGYNFLVD